MPKYLNHLNLNGNQLKNAKLEITDSPTQAKGIIHYHDTSNSVRVYTGTGNSDFFTLGDNDVASVSDAGIVRLRYAVGSTPAANSQSTTAGRTYGVTKNANDQLIVNVPWTDSSALTEDQVEDFAAGMITSATHTGLTTTYNDNAGTLAFAVDGVLEDLDTLGAVASNGQMIVGTGTGTFAYESGATLRTSIGVDAAGTDNSTNVTLANTNYLSLSGQEITGGTVPIGSGGTGATTAGAARTALGVDAAGTDNSTNVTLGSVSNNYLSISGQEITAGNVPISLGGTGQTTAAAAANALLNTNQGGALSIGVATDTITIAGNLTVTGTQTTTLSNTVKTGDNMLELSTNNSANSTDFGWYGKFVDSGTKYAGMHWDASDTRFRLGYGDDVPGTTHTWDNAGHLALGALTTSANLSIGGSLVMDSQTITGINANSDFDDDNAHLMTSAAIKAKIADNDNNFLTAHPSITEASSNLSNSGRTYIQSIGLDSNGHVTSISTATETVTNTNTQLAIASTPEAVAGVDDTKAMTAAKVADRSVLATIDVSNSTFQSNLYAEIDHSLDTADIIVQLYDINTEETVIADVFRTDKAGNASTDKIKIVFSAAPAAANDIRVLITSLKGGQTGTVAYS